MMRRREGEREEKRACVFAGMGNDGLGRLAKSTRACARGKIGYRQRKSSPASSYPSANAAAPPTPLLELGGCLCHTFKELSLQLGKLRPALVHRFLRQRRRVLVYSLLPPENLSLPSSLMTRSYDVEMKIGGGGAPVRDFVRLRSGGGG